MIRLHAESGYATNTAHRLLRPYVRPNIPNVNKIVTEYKLRFVWFLKFIFDEDQCDKRMLRAAGSDV